ncbi:heavy metal-binding domain-containing protein [Aeromonas enteropelogenes]|uniref:heavy metal-binding domain-containing protein n=1 Tax=Aeromonas enteropelogenes TaxID=29489 RepID=UPI003B9F4300
MGVAQKPRSWPRWVNFTPALVGHFYIGGDTQALVQLRKQADELGCNALIGVSIDVDEVAGGGKSMMMVTATGTAIVVEK